LVKRQFPLDDNLLYLNAAKCVPLRVECSTATSNICAISRRIPVFRTARSERLLAERLCDKAARLLGAVKDEIAFGRQYERHEHDRAGRRPQSRRRDRDHLAHNHPSNNDFGVPNGLAW
jgi:hypothetical protein